jgi:hypothetical protein
VLSALDEKGRRGRRGEGGGGWEADRKGSGPTQEGIRAKAKKRKMGED